MFGLDLIFDFDRNGKVDALEHAAVREFLDIVENDAKSKKSDRRKSAYEYDSYENQDEEN